MSVQPVEYIDESNIQSSVLLKIFNSTDANVLDQQIEMVKKPEYDLLIKKIVLILIGRAGGLLSNKASEIVSDHDFVRSLFDMNPDVDRLKTLLKYEIDPRVLKSTEESLRLGIMPYSELKTLYFMLGEEFKFLSDNCGALKMKLDASKALVKLLQDQVDFNKKYRSGDQSEIIVKLTNQVNEMTEREKSTNEKLENKISEMVKLESDYETLKVGINVLKDGTHIPVNRFNPNDELVKIHKEHTEDLTRKIKTLMETNSKYMELLTTVEKKNVELLRSLNESDEILKSTKLENENLKTTIRVLQNHMTDSTKKLEEDLLNAFSHSSQQRLPHIFTGETSPVMSPFKLPPSVSSPMMSSSKSPIRSPVMTPSKQIPFSSSDTYSANNPFMIKPSILPEVVTNSPDINLAKFYSNEYSALPGVVLATKTEWGTKMDGFIIEDPVGMRFLDLDTGLVSTVFQRISSTSYCRYSPETGDDDFGVIESFDVNDGDYLVLFDFGGDDDAYGDLEDKMRKTVIETVRNFNVNNFDTGYVSDPLSNGQLTEAVEYLEDIQLAKFEYEMYKNLPNVVKDEYGYTVSSPIGMKFLDLNTRLVSTVLEVDPNKFYYRFDGDDYDEGFTNFNEFLVNNGEYLVMFDREGIEEGTEEFYNFDRQMQKLASDIYGYKQNPNGQDDRDMKGESEFDNEIYNRELYECFVDEDFDRHSGVVKNRLPESRSEFNFGFTLTSIIGLKFVDLDKKGFTFVSSVDPSVAYCKFSPNQSPNGIKMLSDSPLEVGDFLVMFKLQGVDINKMNILANEMTKSIAIRM